MIFTKTAIIFALIFGFAAHAQVIELKASEYLCQELQDAIEHYGVVVIKSLGSREHFSNRDYCDADQEASAAYVSSKDKILCRVGWNCRTIFNP
jgi:hypothetical protein